MSMSKAKRLWVKLKRGWSDRYADTQDDMAHTSPWLKLGLGVLALYLLLVTVLGIYWSMTPELFSVEDNLAAKVDDRGGQRQSGAAMAATLIRVAEILQDKPGGYLTNDITPPGVWLDNLPAWEYGVVIQVRDASKAMREAFSRSQSQSREDEDLALAESRFNFNTSSWIMPATEKQYREGMKFTRRYLDRLTGISDSGADRATFYARADNLRYWLSTVETRLGSLSQRLSASVGQRRLNTDVPDWGEREQVASDEVEVKTPWLEIDDVYYEARGSAWALIHLLKAAEQDFAEVLEDKNARTSLGQIIRELEATQRTVMSPIILNGSGFGVLANHSLVMGSYISRANAALIDLNNLLDRG